MCGITGIYSKSPQADALSAMTQSLQHRGPDAIGYFINDRKTVAVGHTRLSIIDLSEQANQPMKTSDGRYIIVFNGEIYNYQNIRSELLHEDPSLQFFSNSDTEVILYAFKTWKENMLPKLEGMFAFVIYDAINNSFFMARDRVGKKPLFYFMGPEYFLFASEIKSLLKHPEVDRNKRINYQGIYQFLHLGYIPEPNTIYESVLKFPSGHYAWVNPDFKLSLHSYWNIRNCFEIPGFDKNTDFIAEFDKRLTESVQRRLVSDVPLGTFLSGGNDSSLITALASGLSEKKIKTFTIGFKEQKFDESSYAREVSEFLKTDHHEYFLSERESIEILHKYVEHFDEPFADTSAIPTLLLSSLAKKEIKVALTGDGGDELFLGYGAYDWANRFNNPIFRFFSHPATMFMDHLRGSRYQRISNFMKSAEGVKNIRSHIFSQEQYFFSQNELYGKLLRNPDNYIPFTYFDPDYACYLKEAEKQALFDFNYYLKDDLLVKIDRASMYSGLECRSPFLDHHLVELAMNLPYSFKKKGSSRKWIIKKVLQKHLPAPLINRPKWGFSVPMAKWLKNDLKFMLEEYTGQKIIKKFGIVKYDYLIALKESFDQGQDFLYNRLWLLIVLHKWLNEHPIG